MCVDHMQSLGSEEVTAVLINQLESASAATGNTSQWLIGNVNMQARFLGKQTIDITQQRTTTGQHDAAFGDIRA